jgi:hypothetical protein
LKSVMPRAFVDGTKSSQPLLEQFD